MNTKYFIESAGGTYGPADVDQLIQWISEGRIAPDTVLVDEGTSQRIAAGAHSELRSWFSTQPPAVTPPPPAAPPMSASRFDTPGQPGNYPGGGQQQAYRQPPAAQGYYGNAPLPGVGQYGAQYGQNTSGQGAMAQLPAQLQGLNWGGFFMTFWWAIFNQSWIALLCLVPYIGWVMPFVVLFKGNEWAWQNRRFESPEQFQAVQKAWATWGVALAVVSFVFGILIALLALIGGNNP